MLETIAPPKPEDVVFIITREDVIQVARTLGYPEEMITNDIFQSVKTGVEWEFENWSEVVAHAINFALKS